MARFRSLALCGGVAGNVGKSALMTAIILFGHLKQRTAIVEITSVLVRDNNAIDSNGN